MELSNKEQVARKFQRVAVIIRVASISLFLISMYLMS